MKPVTVKGKKPQSPSRTAGIDDKTMRDLVEVFKSLSDLSRLQILMLLAQEGEMNVSAICKVLDQSQPAVSHHLTQLRQARLVDFRRDGKFNFYKLDSALLTQVMEQFYPNAGSTLQKTTYGDLELSFKAK